MAAWATPAQAARHWPDAPTLDPTRLTELLDAATTACATYAPTLVPPATVPVDWSIATVYQAREIYAASVRDGDLIGVGDYAFRAIPLTAAVKRLLRPEPRVQAIG